MPEMVIEITPHGEWDFLASIHDRPECEFGHTPSFALRHLTMYYPHLFCPGRTILVNIHPDHRKEVV